MRVCGAGAAAGRKRSARVRPGSWTGAASPSRPGRRWPTDMQRIVVLGGGFAGLWSAAGAARMRDELGIGAGALEIMVVNRTKFHSIRVRNYEAELSGTLVPLASVLDPIGVKHVEGEVGDIDVDRRTVGYMQAGVAHSLGYDR